MQNLKTKNILKLHGNVQVIEYNSYYLFDGPGEEKAFIFYQGAKVEEEAYAKFLFKLADNGVDCFLIKMPFRFALFGINKANDILDNYSYDECFIGGHSLGGACASIFYSSNISNINGLILIESRVNTKLNTSSKVLSIIATEDGILNKKSYEESRNNILGDFVEVVVEGGNHSGFANYGEQRKDNKSTISKEEQQTKTIDAILEFLDIT